MCGRGIVGEKSWDGWMDDEKKSEEDGEQAHEKKEKKMNVARRT